MLISTPEDADRSETCAPIHTTSGIILYLSSYRILVAIKVTRRVPVPQDYIVQRITDGSFHHLLSRPPSKSNVGLIPPSAMGYALEDINVRPPRRCGKRSTGLQASKPPEWETRSCTKDAQSSCRYLLDAVRNGEELCFEKVFTIAIQTRGFRSCSHRELSARTSFLIPLSARGSLRISSTIKKAQRPCPRPQFAGDPVIPPRGACALKPQ